MEKNKYNPTHQPKMVGAARNAFGTRLCQRIECSRCNKTDYVSMKISSAKIKYCRSCAERLLTTFEVGRVVGEKQLQRNCDKCKNEFLVSETVANKKIELLCADCYRGFEVWRGKVPADSARIKNHRLIIKSGAKTIIRKIVHDTI